LQRKEGRKEGERDIVISSTTIELTNEASK
jgi:hypothetical protein